MVRGLRETERAAASILLALTRSADIKAGVRALAESRKEHQRVDKKGYSN